MIVWSGCRCSETESVTALICSGWDQTEPDTGYMHLLARSSVTYRGWNAAHIHLPFHDVTYNIDQTLELTVMSIVCSIVILYAKYLATTLRTVQCRDKKCSETELKRCCSSRNSTSTHSGTISIYYSIAKCWAEFVESYVPFCRQVVVLAVLRDSRVIGCCPAWQCRH